MALYMSHVGNRVALGTLCMSVQPIPAYICNRLALHNIHESNDNLHGKWLIENITLFENMKFFHFFNGERFLTISAEKSIPSFVAYAFERDVAITVLTAWERDASITFFPIET